MYCPEHKVLGSRFLWVWMYWRDVPRDTIPLRIWLNPLNYEVSLQTGYGGRRLTLNREGRAIRAWAYRTRAAIARATGGRDGR